MLELVDTRDSPHMDTQTLGVALLQINADSANIAVGGLYLEYKRD